MKKYLCILLAWLMACPAWAYEKNTAGQFLQLVAVDRGTGGPKTGDAANITAYCSIDGDTTPDALGDTSATELSSTNAPGVYQWDLTAGELNGTNILFSGKSTTASIDVIPLRVVTTAPNFAKASIDSNGRVDLIKISGTSQTARDIGASVLLSSGTGSGQLDFTSGVVKANATQISGKPIAEFSGLAKTIYVATTGNDSNAGTSASPKLTINGAIAAMSDGDSCVVGAGTFGAFDSSSLKLITITGAGRSSTTVTTSSGVGATIGNWTKLRGMTCTSTDVSTNGVGIDFQNKFGVVIEDVACNGTYDAFAGEGSKGARIYNSQFIGTYDGGNIGGCRDLQALGSTFATLGTWAGSPAAAGFRGLNVETGYATFYLCGFTGFAASPGSAPVGGVSLHSGSYCAFYDCAFTAIASAGTGRVFGVGDDQNAAYNARIIGGSVSITNGGSGTRSDILAQNASAHCIVEGGLNANPTYFNGSGTIRTSIHPATPGRTLVIDAAGLADANAVKVGPTGSGTAQTAADLGVLPGRLTSARAGYLDNINNSALATTVAQTGDAFARIGAPAGASIAADIATKPTAAALLATTNGSATVATQLARLDAAVSSAVGSFTDSDFANVAPALTWKLIKNSSGELVGDKTLVLDIDTGEKTFAIDFAVDLSANAKITTVDSMTLDSGTANGITFGTNGRERNLAKPRITGVTAGTYVIQAIVTDSENNPHTAKVTLKVID